MSRQILVVLNFYFSRLIDTYLACLSLKIVLYPQQAEKGA